MDTKFTNALVKALKEAGMDVGLLSDGYHTFNELYEFRMLYNAVLFNEWASQIDSSERKPYGDQIPKYRVHKSWRHSDGELCFGGGWFIVVAQLPSGQISNHYEAKYWDLFKIPEAEFGAPYDGHTSKDVVERLKSLL